MPSRGNAAIPISERLRRLFLFSSAEVKIKIKIKIKTKNQKPKSKKIVKVDSVTQKI